LPKHVGNTPGRKPAFTGVYCVHRTHTPTSIRICLGDVKNEWYHPDWLNRRLSIWSMMQLGTVDAAPNTDHASAALASRTVAAIFLGLHHHAFDNGARIREHSQPCSRYLDPELYPLWPASPRLVSGRVSLGSARPLYHPKNSMSAAPLESIHDTIQIRDLGASATAQESLASTRCHCARGWLRGMAKAVVLHPGCRARRVVSGCKPSCTTTKREAGGVRLAPKRSERPPQR
jgi:hypothetical protein